MSETPNVRPERPAEPTPGMTARPAVLDIIRFVVLLAAVASLALWGFAEYTTPWNLVFGIGAPVVAILIWALFLSPRPVLVLHPFIQAVIELLLYVSVTAAWWTMGQTWIGLAFGIVAVVVGLMVGRRRFA